MAISVLFSYNINRFSFRFRILAFVYLIFRNLLFPFCTDSVLRFICTNPVCVLFVPILCAIKSGLYDKCLSYRSLEISLVPIDLSFNCTILLLGIFLADLFVPILRTIKSGLYNTCLFRSFAQSNRAYIICAFHTDPSVLDAIKSRGVT